jgi:DNA-directed RNA polymerase subunit RPC12/RpoP
MAKREVLYTCQECSRPFYSTAAARKASFGDAGCPGCGGSDIDVAPLESSVVAERKASIRRQDEILGRGR